MKHNTLPIFLRNQKVLLIGGGKVAKQKAEVLITNNIDFIVISKDFISDFPRCAKISKKFEKSDLEDFMIVVDATGSKKIGEILQKAKQKRNFLVNRVDKPDECDFFFSSNINRGDLKIAVSTSGASPKAGQIIRNQIKEIIPKNIETLIKEFGNNRKKGVIDMNEIEQKTEEAFNSSEDEQKSNPKIYLIGAGTGDPDLLTLKAVRAIQELDTIFIDHLVSDDIYGIIPTHIKKVYVGKRQGSHSKKQDEINYLLLEEAKKGKVVGRLKAGDPYIFGRGGEEALFLMKHGMEVKVIAGISSAFSFGIPPTHRGLSSGFSVVSAHLMGNNINLTWIPLLKMEKHATVVLMGLSRVKEIQKEALKQEVSKDLPVLLISNISRSCENRILTTLKNLVSDSKPLKKPVVMVFGEIANIEKEFSEWIN
jgi:uroporphyrin-III C-methyltransferase/precorrin-2 dehydrogenase/sirohydrochlorin ferrochelatase